jgi:tRNA dimethylallyltransferase
MASPVNPSNEPRKPLLVIAGPTAIGKTEAAIQVAEAVGGEIVSADSMQIYKVLQAGTAKPTPEERRRAVFHLIDFVDPREPYSVADFQKDAQEAIAGVHSRGRLPILCGGTGLYIRSVLGGLNFPPGATPETKEIRERLEKEADARGIEALHKRLGQFDPATARRLPIGDRRRIIRALEVCEHTGRPFSELACVDATAQVNYNAATFALTCPRSLLYERINARVDSMLADGWLEEVVMLREDGLTLEHQAMQAIGYRHLLKYLDTDGDFGHVVEEIKRDTRRYAKRQLTWFRRENVQWLEWGTPQQFAQAVQQLIGAADDLINPTSG